MQEPSLALLAQGLFIEFDADKSGHINMADLLNLYDRIDLNSRLSRTTKSCFSPSPLNGNTKRLEINARSVGSCSNVGSYVV